MIEERHTITAPAIWEAAPACMDSSVTWRRATVPDDTTPGVTVIIRRVDAVCGSRPCRGCVARWVS